jgi:hypothetical protein
MKIAVMTSLFTKGNVDVDTGHAAKVDNCAALNDS